MMVISIKYFRKQLDQERNMATK